MASVKKATYQVDVDVLGFPMYMEHLIERRESKPSKFNSKSYSFFRVLQRIIKQH